MKRSAPKSPRRIALCLVPLLSVSGLAQTLARPGWTGSGMSTQSWFRHAVFYRIDTRTFAHSTTEASGNLKGIAERLDYIRDLGIDAVLLEPLAASGATSPIDPTLGTIDDFDELSLEASKHDLRVLLTLPKPDPALARFWLTRGVAGFYIPGSSTSPEMAAIRKLLPTFVGQRVLITDADLTGAATKPTQNELRFDSALLKMPAQPPPNLAVQLRAALGQSQALLRSGITILATDSATVPGSVARFGASEHEPEGARLVAAILLLNRSVPVLYAGQELGLAPLTAIPWGKPTAVEAGPSDEGAAKPLAPALPPPSATPSDRYVPYVPPSRPVKPAQAAPPDPASAAGQQLDPTSTLSIYRQFIQLHHGRPSVRDGDEILPNHDDANALILVRKPANASLANPPLVVICNLSSTPLHLALKSELTGMRLRGSFLRSVLQPGVQGVSMNLENVNLQPFGIYIGELRY